MITTTKTSTPAPTASAVSFKPGQPAPKPGDRGIITVGADHVLVDSITGNGFCDQGKTAPGTCGA